MAPTFDKVLRQLRNTRDLKAEILSLAADLAADGRSKGRITVAAPMINKATVQEEWDRLLPAIAPGIRKRMRLEIELRADPANEKSAGSATGTGMVPLDRPNYRFEVLRLLLGASLEGDGPQPEAGIAAHIEGTQVGLIKVLGVSTTPVRGALTALRDAGLIRSLRWLEVEPAGLSMEQLSRVGALPQTLRFRFERGAPIKPPAELLKRAEPLLGPNGPKSWKPFSLSGTAVAQKDVPGLDLVGTPRIDLVARVPHQARLFDANVMRLLDDGLELEPNILAPAPVVVTLVRTATPFERDAGPGQARCAHPCDVFLSLLDMGLREQAMQYAKAVRP